jgi:hypothetical protein
MVRPAWAVLEIVVVRVPSGNRGDEGDHHQGADGGSSGCRVVGGDVSQHDFLLGQFSGRFVRTPNLVKRRMS